MSDERIDLEILDEIAKNAQEMCHHERLLRVNVFATESVVRELIAELKRCYEELDVLEELLRTGLMDEEIYNQVKASM